MAPPVAAQQAPTNGLAIASMVLGILGIIPGVGFLLALLALIFGAVAVMQIRSKGHRGFGMAVTGIVLGAVFLFVWFLFYRWITGLIF